MPGLDQSHQRRDRRGNPIRSRGVVVVEDLVTAMVTGEIRVGELLPTEADLASTFGVSRTVVRESVKRVEEKGMVRVVQGSGTRVSDPRYWNVLDPVVLSAIVEHDPDSSILDEVASLRCDVEGRMAEQAALRRSGADLESLQASMSAMANALDDADDFARADIAFHSVIMSTSGQVIAQAIARRLVDTARAHSARFRGAPDPDEHARTVLEHRLILEAIASGDGERAEATMRAHIADAWRRRRDR